MKLLSTINNPINALANWVDSTPMPQIIDTVTYNVYESNNPFRTSFNEDDISNKPLRIAANTTTTIGAEAFSMFTNPYYLTHKIVNIPTYYKNIVNSYQKNQN